MKTTTQFYLGFTFFICLIIVNEIRGISCFFLKAQLYIFFPTKAFTITRKQTVKGARPSCVAWLISVGLFCGRCHTWTVGDEAALSPTASRYIDELSSAESRHGLSLTRIGGARVGTSTNAFSSRRRKKP